MDTLSDVLALLKPRSYRCGGIDAGQPWAIRFPRHDGIKCYAVVRGACWLALDGMPEPVRLDTGDCFLLPTGRPFRMSSDLERDPVDAATVFSPARNGVISTCNGGGDMLVVGGHFVLAGHHADILLGMLPPIVHLREEPDRAALRWSLERMMQELRERQPGCDLVAQHLVHMMLVLALRRHLAQPRPGQQRVGWLFALADRQMSAAINAMHGDPARSWTLATLASHAGMSRSSFAQKFKHTVGTAPMEYLTRWRMLLAGDRLLHSGDTLSGIALACGYESESAFGTAFKRVMGCSPRQYHRRHLAAPAAAPESGPEPAPA